MSAYCEPWRYDEATGVIADADNKCPVLLVEPLHLHSRRELLRIVRCINLCAHIPDETLFNPDCELGATLRLGGRTPGPASEG